MWQLQTTVCSVWFMRENTLVSRVLSTCDRGCLIWQIYFRWCCTGVGSSSKNEAVTRIRCRTYYSVADWDHRSVRLHWEPYHEKLSLLISEHCHSLSERPLDPFWMNCEESQVSYYQVLLIFQELHFKIIALVCYPSRFSHLKTEVSTGFIGLTWLFWVRSGKSWPRDPCGYPKAVYLYSCDHSS